MNEDLINRLDRLDALSRVHAAEISALLSALEHLCLKTSAADSTFKEIEKIFLDKRKCILHTLLERLEESNPEKAAKLQRIIEDSFTNIPFAY